MYRCRPVAAASRVKAFAFLFGEGVSSRAFGGNSSSRGRFLGALAIDVDKNLLRHRQRVPVGGGHVVGMSRRTLAEKPNSSPPATAPASSSSSPPQQELSSSSDEEKVPVTSSSTEASSPDNNSKNSVEEVLKTVSHPHFRSIQSCDAIIILASRTKSVVGIQDDPRLVKLLKTMQSTVVDQLQTRAIISCLKAMESLEGLDPDNLAVQNLENALLWRARTSPIRDLTLMLSFVSHRQQQQQGGREGPAKLLKEVVRALERRWVELVDARSLASVMHYPECFTEQFLNKLDDRVIETADVMTPSELALILSKKGEKKQRSVPLLKAIAFHLTRGAKELTNKEISDCLFALKELSFKDAELLESLCDSVKVDELESHSVVRSVLTSLGQIKFLHRGILDKITLWIQSRNPELVSTKDLLAYLLTTATLNYEPKNSASTYNVIIQRVTYESLKTASGSELLWLDVVWSLSVLQKQTSSHLASVLSSDFYNKLLYSHDHRNVGIILKVLNLNAVAENLTPGYNGSLISVNEDPLLRDVKSLSNAAKTKLSDTVVDAFSNLAAPPSYANVAVNTMMGFQVDMECVFDQQAKKGEGGAETPSPLPIAEFASLGRRRDEVGKDVVVSKEVPKGAQRLAVMVQSYQDSLIDGSMGGLFALSKRLLEAKGFKVLFVCYSDLKPQLKKIDRIRILESKLKELLLST